MATLSKAARRNEEWAKAQEKLADDEIRALLKSAHEDDLTERERAAAFERVFNANVRLVFIILRQKYFILTETDWDDFEQESKMSLFRAVQLYDYNRTDCKFTTYASRAINNAVRELCRTNRTIPIPDKTSRKIEKVKRVTADFERSYGREPTDEEIAEILEFDEAAVMEYKKFGEQSCLLIGDGMTADDGGGEGDGSEWMTAISREDGEDRNYEVTEDFIDAGIFFSNLSHFGAGVLCDKDVAMIRLVLSTPGKMSQGDIANVFQVTRESITQRARQVRLAVAAAMYITWGPKSIPEELTIGEVQDFVLDRICGTGTEETED